MTWYADTLDCTGKRDTLFNVKLLNDGYKVKINYTRMLSFTKIDRAALYKDGRDDTTKLIPINESACCFENLIQKEMIVTYSTKNLFNIFEDKESTGSQEISGAV
ncbi:MAG TPA: hypothetical protein VLB84_09615 [Bacteroidia bacterium]|nr:hypothetical protein [Bacteroidia bacterium]